MLYLFIYTYLGKYKKKNGLFLYRFIGILHPTKNFPHPLNLFLSKLLEPKSVLCSHRLFLRGVVGGGGWWRMVGLSMNSQPARQVDIGRAWGWNCFIVLGCMCILKFFFCPLLVFVKKNTKSMHTLSFALFKIHLLN